MENAALRIAVAPTCLREGGDTIFMPMDLAIRHDGLSAVCGW